MGSCFFNIPRMNGLYLLSTDSATVSATMGAPSFFPKIRSRFIARDALITSSEFASQGYFRFNFSTAIQRTSPLLIAAPINEIACFATKVTVCQTFNDLGCWNILAIIIFKSLLGWTWKKVVPTRHRLFRKNCLFRSMKVNLPCYVWMVTNLSVFDGNKIGVETRILFHTLDDPFGYCCDTVKGNELAVSPARITYNWNLCTVIEL